MQMIRFTVNQGTHQTLLLVDQRSEVQAEHPLCDI